MAVHESAAEMLGERFPRSRSLGRRSPSWSRTGDDADVPIQRDDAVSLVGGEELRQGSTRLVERRVARFGEQLAERRKGCEREARGLGRRKPAADREGATPGVHVEAGKTGSIEQ